MTVLGGDLAAMRQLASRFVQSGGQFETQTASIAQAAQAALDEFTSEMRSLDQEARSLGDEIDTEVKSVQAESEGTDWTGDKKKQLDQAVMEHQTHMTGIRTRIDNFSTEASSVVNGSLSNILNETQTSARTAGQKAMQVCTGFQGGVNSQANAFDGVMNA